MNRSAFWSRIKSIPKFLLSQRLDRIALVLFVVSLGAASFIGGAYMAEFDLPWYQRMLKPSFSGLAAVQEKYSQKWRTDGWFPARNDKTGVGDYDPQRAYQGLTLYTSMGSFPTAQLITMNGEVVHEWQLPFGKAWQEADDASPVSLEERMHWRRVQLFSDGTILAIYNVLGQTPYGVGLVKIDKDSQLVWRYEGRVHHDFDVDSSGKIYALTHNLRTEPHAATPHLRVPMLEDFVVILTPEGKELKQISIFDAFARSKFKHCLDTIRSDAKGDHTHTNDVEVIPASFAKHHDFCSAGDVIISIRNASILAVLNLEREEIVWAGRGIWEMQHDPDPLDNGNLLVFDNQGGNGAGGRSRILEWNPATNAVEWSYDGTEEKPFETIARGCQQLLPNGNVLITESNNGRILEVTRDGDVAWEYFNPHRQGENDELVAAVYSAQRYGLDMLQFLTPAQLAKASGKVVTTAAQAGETITR